MKGVPSTADSEITCAGKIGGLGLQPRYANVRDKSKFILEKRRRFYKWPKPFSCTDGHYFVAPVGTYRSNPWGLYDMLGNVEEWVDACPEDPERSSRGGDANRATRMCRVYVHRGGSWRSGYDHIRSAHRGVSDSDFMSNLVGFRVARTK